MIRLACPGLGWPSGIGLKPFTTQRLPSSARLSPSPSGPAVTVTLTCSVLLFRTCERTKNNNMKKKRRRKARPQGRFKSTARLEG